MEGAAVELGLDPADDCLEPEGGENGKATEAGNEAEGEDGEGLEGRVAHDVVSAEPLKLGIVGCGIDRVFCVLTRSPRCGLGDIALDDVHAG